MGYAKRLSALLVLAALVAVLLPGVATARTLNTRLSNVSPAYRTPYASAKVVGTKQYTTGNVYSQSWYSVGSGHTVSLYRRANSTAKWTYVNSVKTSYGRFSVSVPVYSGQYYFKTNTFYGGGDAYLPSWTKPFTVRR